MESKQINRNNYEIYLIDYLDGTLSPQMEAELLAFLDQNPDIQDEFAGLQETFLVPENGAYTCKDDLKKNVPDTGIITPENAEQFMIAYYEGDLNAKEERQLMNFLADAPEYHEDFELFAKTKLTTNTQITYARKDDLFKLAAESGERISEENVEEFLTAQLEGDLNPAQEEALRDFISQNPAAKKEAELFAQLKLQADKSIVYPAKTALKHRQIGIFQSSNNIGFSAAAAAILLLISFYFLWNRPTTNTPYNVVAVKRYEVPENRMLLPKTKESHKLLPTETALAQSNPVNSPNRAGIKTNIHNVNTEEQKNRPIVSLAYIEPKSTANIPLDKNQLEIENNMAIYAGLLQQSAGMEQEGKGIVLNGFAGKFVTRISNLLGKGDRLKKDKLRGQAQNLANIAINSYRLLVESERPSTQNEALDRLEP